MKEVLECITIFGGIGSIVVLSAFFYDCLTDDEQKRNHKRKLSDFLVKIQSMRSLELAQNDAALILSGLNYVYGKPSENRFLSLDFWLWRPLRISILLAAVYLLPVYFIIITYVVPLGGSWINLMASITVYFTLVFINAPLDLISVNVSRLLFYKMAKSSHLRAIVLFILIDFVAAILLYLTGPLWLSIIAVFTSGVDYFSNFLTYIQFWKILSIYSKLLLGIMFLTTLVPTIFHFLISIVFVFSKKFAQPVRIGFEKTLEYMISKPKGVTALIALFGTIIFLALVWILVWIYDILINLV